MDISKIAGSFGNIPVNFPIHVSANLKFALTIILLILKSMILLNIQNKIVVIIIQKLLPDAPMHPSLFADPYHPAVSSILKD